MTATRNEITALFARFAGQQATLVIPRPYIDLCESDHLAALFLSQVLYWGDRTSDPDGWFAKSYADWEKELALTERQIKRIVSGDDRRKEKGFSLADVGLETKLARSDYYQGAATLHYRVNYDVLSAKIVALSQVPTNGQNDDPTNGQNDHIHRLRSETIDQALQEKTHLATQEQPAKPENPHTGTPSGAPCVPLSKFGYTVGDTAWLVEDSEFHRVPTIHEVKVIRFTKHMVEIEYDDNGTASKKMRRPHTLSKTLPKLERKTTPLQDALAECLFSIPLDAPIGRRTMIDLQTYAGEILTPYPAILPEHVRAAFAWKGEFKPSKASMVVKMLGDYREYLVSTRPQNGDKAAPTFTHDPACTRCNYGMVIDSDGKSAQCQNCAASKEKEIA